VTDNTEQRPAWKHAARCRNCREPLLLQESDRERDMIPCPHCGYFLRRVEPTFLESTQEFIENWSGGNPTKKAEMYAGLLAPFVLALALLLLWVFG
jgi:DNA-directed RNA polymerase subunit RPC12/RpoP